MEPAGVQSVAEVSSQGLITSAPNGRGLDKTGKRIGSTAAIRARRHPRERIGTEGWEIGIPIVIAANGPYY